VEPVYFGLVDLLLQQSAVGTDSGRRTALLSEAQDRLEELKSAELRDYFHDPCLAPERKVRAETIPGAVIVYPVIFPDRTELIVNRGGVLTSIVVPIPKERLDREVNDFRRFLQKRQTREYRPYAARLYDWIIRPLEQVIGDQPVDALVFVSGGSLRTVPMGALYDREAKQFLIEKFPIAVLPALSLTDPRPIDRANVRTLLAGLTVPVQGFPALESVGSELDMVADIFSSKTLVDDDFVMSAIESSLTDETFGIVHIATHGQFRSDASDSFLLTYDGRIGLGQLGVLVERTRFRGEPIELLTLSACETAVGDDRAALGLAGIAVRAGARSALATLWTVNDQAAAQLIGEFYRQLAQPGRSRAEALRRAQVSLLEERAYRHPGYWAPFLLISNWM
jgi:CHAT domain-containing protein